MRFSYNKSIYDIEVPNICPHCHVFNHPIYRWYSFSTNIDNEGVFISSWECANDKCNRIFVSLHTLKNDEYVFTRFLNGLPNGPDWPKPILNLKSIIKDSSGQPEEIKSKFILIYLQSLEAENYGLNEIAGMGYRKAIEHLVKDWAIKNNPKDIETIQGLWLGEVIKNYYSGDLKDILERATWLGNDQAHYLRLFDDYNVSHLKELIGFIMVELDREFKKKHYIDSIQKKK